MTRFMGIPPFEFELDSGCYVSLALGRAEAGWTLRGTTWRGSRFTGTIGPNLTVNPHNLPLPFCPRRWAVPHRQPASEPVSYNSFPQPAIEFGRPISPIVSGAG
jgi:hypothetical protein